MKTGAMNYPNESLIKEMESITSMGFDFIDLTIEAPEATPEIISKNLGKIRAQLSGKGMFLVGHMAWFLEISHPYESIRRAVVGEIGKALEVAQKLGIRKFTIHPHETPGIYARELAGELLKLNIKSIRDSVRIAEPLGISVCVENNPVGLFSKPGDFGRLFKMVPEAGFHLDMGHAFVAGGQDLISEFAGEFGRRLMHVHVHDNNGRSDDHLPIGAGRIDFGKALAAVKKTGYDGTFTMELHSRDPDYLKISREKFLKIWKSL